MNRKLVIISHPKFEAEFTTKSQPYLVKYLKLVKKMYGMDKMKLKIEISNVGDKK